MSKTLKSLLKNTINLKVNPKKTFLVAVSFLSLFLAAPSLWAASSVYTSVEEKKCKMLQDSSKDPEAEIDYFTMSCPGRDGYEIIVDGGDARSWLVIKKKGKEIYDMRVDEFNNAPGGFPYVGGKVLEWCYSDAKKLTALIIRITGQGPDSSNKEVSKLFVIRHQDGKFCFLGSDPTNEGARKLADSPQACR